MLSLFAASAPVFSIGTVACVLGGLGIFLLGMKQISEGLQAVAGPKMRKLVAAATTNRFAGVLTGATVTTIIQSSSVTTVMVVGMVISGLMTLSQSINVILGANIGTTVTAWLVAIFPKLGTAFGLGLAGAAAMVHLFAKKESWKYWGLIFLGFGLIFYGLDLINSYMKPISGLQSFQDALAAFSVTAPDGGFTGWGMVKCLAVGAIGTAIVQSSSAMTGLVVIFVTQADPLIDFNTAATLVLGMNIGTTITTWFAAIGATTDARRAALAHTLFNIIGVLLMAPLFPLLLPGFKVMCEWLGGILCMDIASPAFLGFMVAAVHTAFNVVNTAVFLPFTQQYAWLITRIIPDAKVRELPRLTVLDPQKVSPVVAVEQARKEVEQMSYRCEELFGSIRTVVEGKSTDALENDIFHAEEELDMLQHEVTEFLGVIMTTNLPSDVANRARMLLRVADEFESVSDEAAAILKLFIRMRRAGTQLSDRGREDLLSLHDMCREFAGTVFEAFRQGKVNAVSILSHIHSDASGISSRVKEIRKAQMTRLADRDPTIDPVRMVIVLDVLNIYRRLKEDCLNIGEAMLDEGR